VPFKSHCYFFKIYFAADTSTPKPEADLLDLISRNRDIVYCTFLHRSSFKTIKWG